MHNSEKRKKPIPIYYQIEESIRQDIAAGRLSPGDRLPTEQQLCDLFKVSRMTVRQALQNLISDGVVQRRRGHGPVVALSNVVHPLSHFSGFSDTLAAQGIHVTTKVLSLQTLPATGKEAAWLQVREGDPILFLRRLRLVDGTPIALQHTFLPKAVVGPIRAAELEEQPLYHLLDRRGFQLESATQKVSACMPTKLQCRLLALSSQTPLLYTERSSRLIGGVPLEFACSWYNSSRFSMTVELGS